jgi:DNA-binding Lrp family transcriptional regulator
MPLGAATCRGPVYCHDARCFPERLEGGAMPTRAYILIKVKAGKTKEVVKSLKKVAGVEQVHPCFGQPDIFTFVNVPDEKALSDVVITKVHTIEGVEETDTHIVADT